MERSVFSSLLDLLGEDVDLARLDLRQIGANTRKQPFKRKATARKNHLIFQILIHKAICRVRMSAAHNQAHRSRVGVSAQLKLSKEEGSQC